MVSRTESGVVSFTKQLYLPHLQKCLGDKIFKSLHPKEIDWLCNKCSNKYAQMKRKFDVVHMDSFFVQKIEESTDIFQNDMYMEWVRDTPSNLETFTHQIENAISGSVYVFGFYFDPSKTV